MHFGTSEQVTPLSLLESWTLSKPSGKQLFKLLAIFEKKNVQHHRYCAKKTYVR
jgi:hypothetical protein